MQGGKIDKSEDIFNRKWNYLEDIKNKKILNIADQRVYRWVKQVSPECLMTYQRALREKELIEQSGTHDVILVIKECRIDKFE